MDFLGIGVPEAIVIIILALIFIGPRDLPRMAAKAGKLLRDVRMMSEGFTTEWRREINAVARMEDLQELRAELEATRKALAEAGHEIKSAMEIDLEELEREAEAEQAARQARSESEPAAEGEEPPALQVQEREAPLPSPPENGVDAAKDRPLGDVVPSSQTETIAEAPADQAPGGTEGKAGSE